MTSGDAHHETRRRPRGPRRTATLEGLRDQGVAITARIDTIARALRSAVGILSRALRAGAREPTPRQAVAGEVDRLPPGQRRPTKMLPQ